MLDLLSDSAQDDNSSESFSPRLSAEQNASKYEADLREVIFSVRNQSKTLTVDRAELDRLRSEADKSGEDVRNLQAAIRLSQASSRETRARCVATFLSNRVISLTRNLTVGVADPLIR